jgi:hypothetical protein
MRLRQVRLRRVRRNGRDRDHLLIPVACWQLGFIGKCGAGADSLPTLRLEPADLLVTLSEDRASEWPNPSPVSSDRCASVARLSRSQSLPVLTHIALRSPRPRSNWLGGGLFFSSRVASCVKRPMSGPRSRYEAGDDRRSIRSKLN